MSRLVYRKGVDLLVDIIPHICNSVPNVHFVIGIDKIIFSLLLGGDGNQRVLLEEVRDRCQLHDQVEMLGVVKHEDVRSVSFEKFLSKIQGAGSRRYILKLLFNRGVLHCHC